MHQPYPKIRFRLDPHANISGEWILTEKIHGAALALSYQDGEFYLAKRKARLSYEDLSLFFGVDKLYPVLHIAGQKIINHLGLDINWTIYGELAGNGYPGDSAVQQGVFYAPNLIFFAFDMVVNQEFVEYDKFATLMQLANLPTPPLIGRGKYQNLIQTPVEFQTRVPFVLGFDPLANNLAEGWVLKPAKACPFNDRPIIKLKRADFAEESSQRPLAVANSSFDYFMYLAVNKLNTARINSARSKTGPGSTSLICDEVTFDILEELKEEHGLINSDILSQLVKELQPLILDLITSL